MALQPQLGIQNLQFLRLAVRFVRNVRRHHVGNVRVAQAALAVAQNMLNTGSQWLNFMILVRRYLTQQRMKKKRLVTPHLLVQLMRGYR